MRLIWMTALAMVAFAANSILNRMAVGGGWIDPVSFAVWRVGAGAVVLGVVLALRHWRSGALLWPGLRGRVAGVVGLLVYLFGFSFAYAALGAGVGALILFGLVQLTMFGGALVARELVPLRRWIGAGIAFAGLIVLLLPGGGAAVDGWAAGSMALAGLGWGIYSLAGRASTDPLAATAWNFLFAAPFAVLSLLVGGAAGGAATPAGIVLASVSGGVTSGLGYALWYAVVPALGAARAAAAQLTVPVLAAVGGAVLMAEGIGLRMILSTALVLGGVALASLGGAGGRRRRG